MIFIDTNVFVYHVGDAHPLREESYRSLVQARKNNAILVTSAEVLQELLHVKLVQRRPHMLASVFALVEGTVHEVWSLEPADVYLARELVAQHPGLESRDLVHMASCIRRGASQLMTFDRALAAAWDVHAGYQPQDEPALPPPFSA